VRYLAGVATLKYDPEKCAGCGRCAEVCPHGVFEMRDRRAVLADRDLCMECGACASNCEAGAIGVNSGVGCASAIINSMITGGPPSCDCSGTSKDGACC
jgi:NAD-dependent dihydropyrimidine dehydrogenase PreA subunit